MPGTSEPPLPDWLTILRVPGLREPTGLSVLGKSLFVADHEAGDIFKLDWGEAAGGSALPAQARASTSAAPTALAAPHGVLALETKILVADTLNHRIVTLDHDLAFVGERSSFAGRPLSRPHALDSNVPNEFLIADTDNGRLIRVAGETDEEIAITALVPPLAKPCGLCLSPGEIFVADTYNHRIVVTARDGTSLRTYGVEGSFVGAFRYPVAVACWQQWFVVADEFNKRLQLWRSDDEGDYWTATCVSSNLCAPFLGKPFGVTFNPDGRLFVADRLHARILMVDFETMLAATAYDAE